MIKAVIIDDDMTTLQGLSQAVPWDRYQIEICGTGMNGLEGLELIEKYKPQLILTDIYMPVMDGIEMLKQMRAAGNEAEVIILSGYEDFKFAQSAVKLRVADYLSKPATISEIEEVLQEVTQRIYEHMKEAQEEHELRELLDLHRPNTRKLVLKGVLESHFTRTPFFEKACKQLQLRFEHQAFAVVLMEYAVPRNRRSNRLYDTPIYTYALSNLIEEMSMTNREVVLADSQQQVLALLVMLPKHLREETIKQRVRYVIGQVVDNVKKYLKLEVWVAIGKVATNVHEIAASHSSALKLLANRDVIHESLMISEDDLERMQKTVELPRLMDSYQELIRYVMDGQADLADKQIDRIGDTLRQVEVLNIQLLQSSIIELIGMLTVSLYDEGILYEDLKLNNHWVRELERIYHLDDYIAYITELMKQACDAVSGRGNHKHQRTVDFMKRYVQEHYSEEITLDDIAEKVFLTRNYLSQIFKQVTGENYNSYITRIRMEKAKEMMLSGKYKLYEIAQLVGYKNNAYFSQQFKKYTGKSPSEYG